MSLRFESRAPWGSMNERMRQAGRAVCTELGQEGQRFLKETMRAEGKTDTDLTAQNVKAGPVEEPMPGLFRCTVATSPQQMTPAVILEEGRKPGKGVSAAGRAKIAVWARRKARDFVARLRAEAEAANMRRTGKKRAEGKVKDRQKAAEEQAAFLIARSIKRRGMKAFKFFARAKAHVQEKAAAIQKRVLARFAVGGAR